MKKKCFRYCVFTLYGRCNVFNTGTAGIAKKIVTGLEDLYTHDIADRDMQGALYEYMLGKLATAGRNGQFRTPKHIREILAELRNFEKEVAREMDELEKTASVGRERNVNSRINSDL